MPHRDIEIHLHPRDPRGRIWSYRLRARTTRAAGALLVLFVLLLVAGVVAAPRAVRVRLSERDYRAGVALRQELGERLQALVGRFGELAEQGRNLIERTDRICRIYGLAPVATSDEDELPSAGAPAKTIYARRLAEGNRTEARLTLDLRGLASALDRIEAYERAHPGLPRSVPVGAPVSGENVVMASGFGPRRSAYTQQIEFHSGIDLAAPRGTQVVAPADGTVAWSGTMPATPRDDWWRLGRAIVLRHGDEYRTILGHLSAVRVSPGQRVRRGEAIGEVGDTGWTTAPSLHFEIRRRDGEDWIALDPRGFLLSLPAPSPAADSPAVSRDPGEPGPQPLPRAFRR